MKQDRLVREGNRDLIIYMLGWAATPNAMRHIATPGYDVLACYDYRSMAPLRAEDFAPRYRRIYLFAWSFGVWVSEQCCRELPLYRAVALNGTPFPADERYGLRLRVLIRTMRAMAKAGGNPFAEPGGEGVRYSPPGPWAELSIEEKIDELNLLAERSRADSAAHIPWHAACIGSRDEIFPPDNMRAYWEPLGIAHEFESYHYPFADPAVVTDWLGE